MYFTNLSLAKQHNKLKLSKAVFALYIDSKKSNNKDSLINVVTIPNDKQSMSC